MFFLNSGLENLRNSFFLFKNLCFEIVCVSMWNWRKPIEICRRAIIQTTIAATDILAHDEQIPNQMLVTTEIAGNSCTTMGKNILRTSFNDYMNCGCDRANTSCLALVILTSPTWRETEPRNIAHLEREGGHQPHHSQLTWYSCPTPWVCSVWLVDGRNNAHITILRKQGPNHKAIQTDVSCFFVHPIHI